MKSEIETKDGKDVFVPNQQPIDEGVKLSAEDAKEVAEQIDKSGPAVRIAKRGNVNPGKDTNSNGMPVSFNVTVESTTTEEPKDADHSLIVDNYGSTMPAQPVADGPKTGAPVSAQPVFIVEAPTKK